MEASRKLGDEFVEKLGIKNCYYQPPSSEKLVYPCIIYRFDRMDKLRADNRNYVKVPRYNVLYIHKDPGIEMVDKILETFNRCSHDRRYTANNLYHDSFSLYYK